MFPEYKVASGNTTDSAVNPTRDLPFDSRESSV